MINELEIFLVCHDQNIILQQAQRYEGLLHRWVFVGSGPIDKLADLDNVIIARNLPDNIEQYKNLVSFTAWYAIVKNNLIRTPYISVLEYDIELSSDFYKRNLTSLKKRDRAMIGYVVWPLNSPLFLHATPHLCRSLAEVYKIDVQLLIQEHMEKTGKLLWTSTSNMSMDKDTFIDFVDWFIPLSETFREDPLGAHVHERCFKVYSVLTGIPCLYLPNILHHIQEKSHKIEALI